MELNLNNLLTTIYGSHGSLIKVVWHNFYFYFKNLSTLMVCIFGIKSLMEQKK
jgi:hypothetical protein